MADLSRRIKAIEKRLAMGRSCPDCGWRYDTPANESMALKMFYEHERPPVIPPCQECGREFERRILFVEVERPIQ